MGTVFFIYIGLDIWRGLRIMELVIAQAMWIEIKLKISEERKKQTG
jgi:hypothetical protein